MFSRMKKFLLFLAPSMLLGFAVGTVPGYKTYDFVWRDPNFCYSCHVHDYATVGWSHSAHGTKTTCHDCHHQPLRMYMKEAYLMATKPPKFPKDLDHTPYVKKDLCAACHIAGGATHDTVTGPMEFEEITKIPKVNLSHLHRIHLDKETDFTLLNTYELSESERDPEHPHPPKEFPKTKGEMRSVVCADCHGGPANRGHNFTAVDGACVRCHDKQHKTPVAKEYGCRNCHFQGFLIPYVAPTPTPAPKSK